MFYLLLTGLASAGCDLGVFNHLSTPTPPAGGHGVVTGQADFDGMSVVGGNFSRASEHGVGAWRLVLEDADSQDVWVPKQFGYERSDPIDRDHVYLAFDLGFLGDMFHVRRQLVVEVHNVDTARSFQSCWWMVDPEPFKSRLAGLMSDVEWERAMFGRWEVTPQPGGGSIVSYQWWSQAGKVPSSVLRYAVSHSMPDLLDAFDARVGQLASRR